MFFTAFVYTRFLNTIKAIIIINFYFTRVFPTDLWFFYLNLIVLMDLVWSLMSVGIYLSPLQHTPR